MNDTRNPSSVDPRKIPGFFRVFRNRSECVASNFQPLALNWENWLWWSDRTGVGQPGISSEIADEFIEKVKSKKIVGTTEVNVVYYCLDLLLRASTHFHRSECRWLPTPRSERTEIPNSPGNLRT